VSADLAWAQLLVAVADLAVAWDGLVAMDNAGHFTCTELDALAIVFATAGQREAAEEWVGVHAKNPDEEEDDLHFKVDPAAYVAALIGESPKEPDGPRTYDHQARPDDDPEPGDRCKVCGEFITWIGPSPTSDWLHENDEENW
jgi:hypothetical protein